MYLASKLIKRLKKIRQTKKPKFQSIQLSSANGEQFDLITPLVHENFVSIENGAGHVIFKGCIAERPIKVYEVKNLNHCKFIEDICSRPNLAHIFPEVIWTQGRFVAAEWIEGDTATNSTPEMLLELLYLVQQEKLGTIPNRLFDYWHDFVTPRFIRAGELVGEISLVAKTLDRVSAFWDAQPPYLSHPDITRSNVVINKAKGPILIDNEFLSVGRLKRLDFYNLVNSLHRSEVDSAVQYWSGLNHTEVSEEEALMTEIAWSARVIGSALQLGALQKISNHFSKIKTYLG